MISGKPLTDYSSSWLGLGAADYDRCEVNMETTNMIHEAPTRTAPQNPRMESQGGLFPRLSILPTTFQNGEDSSVITTCYQPEQHDESS
jgi:hypothetical protein